MAQLPDDEKKEPQQEALDVTTVLDVAVIVLPELVKAVKFLKEIGKFDGEDEAALLAIDEGQYDQWYDEWRKEPYEVTIKIKSVQEETLLVARQYMELLCKELGVEMDVLIAKLKRESFKRSAEDNAFEVKCVDEGKYKKGDGALKYIEECIRHYADRRGRGGYYYQRDGYMHNLTDSLNRMFKGMHAAFEQADADRMAQNGNKAIPDGATNRSKWEVVVTSKDGVVKRTVALEIWVSDYDKEYRYKYHPEDDPKKKPNPYRAFNWKAAAKGKIDLYGQYLSEQTIEWATKRMKQSPQDWIRADLDEAE